MKQVLLTIHGQVQGVAYRYNSQKEALKLGLKGYAKNLSNGSVEILAQGEEKRLNEFIEWCKQGPSLAYVKTVEISWEVPNEYFSDFETF